MYMWNLKYDTHKLIYETERVTDVENRLVSPRGRVGEKGGLEVSAYSQQIFVEHLLCSRCFSRVLRYKYFFHHL